MDEIKHLRKKRIPSFRTTISTPAKLRARMDRFQLKFYVNWSKIATLAWEDYMNRVEKENAHGPQE